MDESTPGFVPRPPANLSEVPRIPEQDIQLPEIVIPEILRVELRSSITELLNNPPDVDVLLVPARSGTIAAAGLLGDSSRDVRNAHDLPTLTPVSGLGREVYNKYDQWVDTLDECEEDGESLTEVGEWGNDVARKKFGDFVTSINAGQEVDTTIRSLREALAPLINRNEGKQLRIALLDDIYDTGIVTEAVGPILLQAALDRNSYVYDRSSNRYLFKTKDWIKQIVRTTFANNIPNLDERTIDFLATIAKGSLDERLGTVGPGEYTMESLSELAIFYAEREMRDSRFHTIPPVATLSEPIQKYGQNLLGLHQALVESIRSLTEEILSDYGNMDGGAH